MTLLQYLYTKDRANLFATIVGILDSENINFVDAKLYGMKDGHCMDLITISDVKKFLQIQKGISLCKKLLNSLDQKTLSPKIIQRRQPRHLKHFKPVQV